MFLIHFKFVTKRRGVAGSSGTNRRYDSEVFDQQCYCFQLIEVREYTAACQLLLLFFMSSS